MPVTEPPAVSFTNRGTYLEILVTCPGMTGLMIFRTFLGVRTAVDMTTVPPPSLDRWRGHDAEVPSGEVTYDFTVFGSASTTSGAVHTITFDRPGDYFYDFTLGPETGMYLNVESFETERRTAIGRQVLNVMHRNDPVVVTFGRGLPEGELILLTMNDTERIWFEKFLATQQLLVFQPRADAHTAAPKFLAIGDVDEERTTKLVHEDSRRFKLQVNEVGRPVKHYSITLPDLSATRLWIDVEAMGSWATVEATGDTWAELVGYIVP